MERSRTRPIILLVEDYIDSQQMLKLLLESLNYRVLAAANGKAALVIAAGRPIDLLLTDFNLPDMTGATLVRRLRKIVKNVPTVILTAYDGDEYRQLAYEAGCNAFLSKPTDFDLLARTLDGLLKPGTAAGTKSVKDGATQAISTATRM